jgi:hypothetical protein
VRAHIDKIINILSSIGIYFSATAIFPHIDNKDLLQSSINIDKLTAFLMLGLYLLFLGVGRVWRNIRLTAYWFAGLISLIGFLCCLFLFYYPFVNKKIVKVGFDCGAVFVRGDSINYDRLDTTRGINFDSLSRVNPASFIQKTDCDPSIGWTVASVERNYDCIVWLYIANLVLFSISIFSLIRAGFQGAMP